MAGIPRPSNQRMKQMNTNNCFLVLPIRFYSRPSLIFFFPFLPRITQMISDYTDEEVERHYLKNGVNGVRHLFRPIGVSAGVPGAKFLSRFSRLKNKSAL
jgi:hypothetical protein